MKRDFYSDSISEFIKRPIDEIRGILTENNQFSLEQTQKDSWNKQITSLKDILKNYYGSIFFEYAIPRMGRRIDVVLIIQNVIFILEFKVGEKEYLSSAIDQVWDYALDLKNFHKTSHEHLIAPILIATEAKDFFSEISIISHNDNVLFPIKTNSKLLSEVIKNILEFSDGAYIDAINWSKGTYSPTPTIIEAAMALYNNHSVADISRSDAAAINLTQTSDTISEIIEKAKSKNEKAICLITGVPGAGKTLVGLDIANKHLDKEKGTTSVFLSGNGPLVAILREALTRDKVKREKENGNKIKKGEVMSRVKVFIQNVHHFRDECLIDENSAPFDHIAIFDEAQRAWNLTQTVSFMQQKKNVPNFSLSEPEFLISCLDRHKDWAVIICLVGGGQEINTGEAGISEWLESINRSYPDWNVHISSELTDSEYAAGEALKLLENRKNVFYKKQLHLSVSMRSFRAEYLSHLVKNILDIDFFEAKRNYNLVKEKYPIVLTRNLTKAKKWLKEKARGSERYGIVVSSQAQRLKPHAIDVKSPIDPIHWFLDGKEDVRSSYFLEDVATEFHVQGLELDWTCVTWDADFRFSENGWQTFSFVGDKWHNIKKEERKMYLKNAYRVILTRARQGMVIVVPEGDIEDHTRKSEFYDCTYNYLKEIGLEKL
jgi:adenylate kinase family enzyme